MPNTLEPQPTLRQMKLFIAAAQEGAFAAAAEAMHVTPNAVSSAVTELETTFNAQLVIRSSAKALTATAAGQDLATGATARLDPAAELALHIGNTCDVPRGSVNVGCYSTWAATISPELWAQVAQQLPEVQLDIQEGPIETLAQHVLHGRLDMMISYRVG